MEGIRNDRTQQRRSLQINVNCSSVMAFKLPEVNVFWSDATTWKEMSHIKRIKIHGSGKIQYSKRKHNIIKPGPHRWHQATFINLKPNKGKIALVQSRLLCILYKFMVFSLFMQNCACTWVCTSERLQVQIRFLHTLHAGLSCYYGYFYLLIRWVCVCE